MDFNVNVNVKLDATPALVGAVSALAGVVKTAEVLQPRTIVTDGPVHFVPSTAASEQKTEQIAPSVPETSAQQPAPQVEEKKQGEIIDEMLRKIVGPVSKAKGKEAVFAVLGEFGVKRVPDLKQEQRQAFIDKVNAL